MVINTVKQMHYSIIGLYIAMMLKGKENALIYTDCVNLFALLFIIFLR